MSFFRIAQKSALAHIAFDLFGSLRYLARDGADASTNIGVVDDFGGVDSGVCGAAGRWKGRLFFRSGAAVAAVLALAVELICKSRQAARLLLIPGEVEKCSGNMGKKKGISSRDWGKCPFSKESALARDSMQELPVLPEEVWSGSGSCPWLS